ncbi:MAG TPA: hypothetical protein VGX71_16460 [Pseudaminobacter sp.]|nr:hypothetical protein [Pseudaminobacter sp.]
MKENHLDLPLGDPLTRRVQTERVKSQPTKPIAKVDGNNVSIYSDAGSQLGISDPNLSEGLLKQLIYAACQDGGKPDEANINLVGAIVAGIEPDGPIEALLAAQMAAVHMAMMTFAKRLTHVKNIPQQDSAERAFNKLARTFAAQVEALKKYRTGGQQHVTVKHVTVNEGGQAIVGNVSHGGQGDGKK